MLHAHVLKITRVRKRVRAIERTLFVRFVCMNWQTDGFEDRRDSCLSNQFSRFAVLNAICLLSLNTQSDKWLIHN